MVIRAVAAIAVLMVASACVPRNQCTSGSELEPPLCPLELPAIQSLTITENAAKSPADQDPAVSCASFKVDEAGVRRYLESAKSTNANDAHHTLDYSPCYASGAVTFVDGRRGRWSVSQLRSGSLAIGDAAAVTLYCPKCEFAPFQ